MTSEDPLVRALREHVALKPVKREVLAERIGIAKPTLDKFFIGQYGPTTRMRVEAFLRGADKKSDLSAKHLGSYSREQAAVYIGEYAFIRPDFKENNNIYAFRIHIEWDNDLPGLRFKAFADGKYEKTAFVTMARGTMYLQIFHTDKGWCSLMMVTSLDASARMYGSMLAMGNIVGNVFLPMVIPVCFWKKKLSDSDIGQIDNRHPRFSEYSSWLSFARDQDHVKIRI
jgi:hypothetical protein